MSSSAAVEGTAGRVRREVASRRLPKSSAAAPVYDSSLALRRRLTWETRASPACRCKIGASDAASTRPAARHRAHAPPIGRDRRRMLVQENAQTGPLIGTALVGGPVPQTARRHKSGAPRQTIRPGAGGGGSPFLLSQSRSHCSRRALSFSGGQSPSTLPAPTRWPTCRSSTWRRARPTRTSASTPQRMCRSSTRMATPGTREPSAGRRSTAWSSEASTACRRTSATTRPCSTSAPW
jgi:hypothetical protein